MSVFAAYVRLSTKDDRALKEQLDTIRYFLDRADRQSAWQYIDYVPSDTPFSERPGFKQLLVEQRFYGFKDVVVVGLDRVSRDPSSAELMKHMLAKRGIKLVEVNKWPKNWNE